MAPLPWAPWATHLIPGVAALTLLLALGVRRRRWPADRYKRGARVLTGRRARRAVRRRARGAVSGVALAGVPIAAAEECRHFKLIGTTGTGKSTAIAALLQGALERGDRAVVADADGGYAARFYAPRRGDVILNPFDARSAKWDPFAEVAARLGCRAAGERSHPLVRGPLGARVARLRAHLPQRASCAAAGSTAARMRVSCGGS